VLTNQDIVRAIFSSAKCLENTFLSIFAESLLVLASHTYLSYLVLMHLLNTSTLKPQEFLGNRIPPYVILSHTWDAQEVSLQDLQQISFSSSEQRFVTKSTENQRDVCQSNPRWIYVGLDRYLLVRRSLCD
jgi:hypothetical protein